MGPADTCIQVYTIRVKLFRKLLNWCNAIICPKRDIISPYTLGPRVHSPTLHTAGPTCAQPYLTYWAHVRTALPYILGPRAHSPTLHTGPTCAQPYLTYWAHVRTALPYILGPHVHSPTLHTGPTCAQPYLTHWAHVRTALPWCRHSSPIPAHG